MSAHYDFYETPSSQGKEGKRALHARIYPKKTYTKEEFIEQAARFHHFSKNILGASLDILIDELGELLADGNIVELGELGFLSTSVKCLKDTDDDKQKIRAESVVFQNVHLRISSTFRKRMMHEMTLERVHSPLKKSKRVTSTVEERKEILIAFLEKNACITRKEYIQLTKLTPYAAMNELNSLIQQGFLRCRGTGRSVVYIQNKTNRLH
ncbi:DNA-binding protein [Bacteroides sp. UBA939]|uniref:HU family DNA-binding protein n=1 Tax=Bacteroides sp. UBA939 TaxID=1946092 RepID=UPI0025C1C230|nr:DNA-binding protein [Bacteroides sp. UBA939]